MEKQKQKTIVALLSIISNSVLIILKIISGIFTGSISIFSEAAHSSMDLIASIIAFFAVKISAKSPDREHPFGHGKVEDISSLAEALLILIAAVWIIYEAVQKLIHKQPLEALGAGSLVMLISVIANFTVSKLLFKVGRKTESPALIADAWHLRTDVYTSAGVFAAITLIWAGKLFLPGLYMDWLDPATALLVALLICRAAFTLVRDAIRDLIDTSPPKYEMLWLENYFKTLYPTVRSIHRVRIRKSGPLRFIDLHLVVDPSMTVTDSHEIAERMTAAIREKFEGADLTIHIEPCDGLCKKACTSGCMMSEKERLLIKKS